MTATLVRDDCSCEVARGDATSCWDTLEVRILLQGYSRSHPLGITSSPCPFSSPDLHTHGTDTFLSLLLVCPHDRDPFLTCSEALLFSVSVQDISWCPKFSRFGF